MPSILVISLYGKSFFTDVKYKGLLPVLLTKAVVHESLSIDEASSYITSGWPTVLLITDPVLTQRKNAEFTSILVKWVHGGGTAIFMGRFSTDVEWPDLNSLLQLFHKDSIRPWAMIAYSKEHVKINKSINGLRTHTLPETSYVKATFLKNVKREETLYYHKSGDQRLCSAAYAPIGFGWLGYIGDMEYHDGAEKTIIAMCRLDDYKFNIRDLP